METPFIPVTDSGTLEQLFADSHSAPVLLYQHDPFCGVSARAQREMVQLEGPVHVVNVARQHDLTRLISERTGVRHESPQVLLLRDGRAAWSASHRAITVEAVRAALTAEVA